MFDSVRALAVYVQDTEKARDFYTRVLGFEVESEVGPDLFFLRSPNGNIRIHLEGGKNPTFADRDSCRLSFFLRSAEPASVIHERLEAAGVTLLQDSPQQVDDATACFQLVDPDGNIVEVCGPML